MVFSLVLVRISFEDPFSELIKLYRTGSVLEYQGKLEKLLAKAGPFT